MNSKKAVLSLILIVLLGSQWLMPSHLWTVSMARSAPAHVGHGMHDHSSSSMVTPLQHPCCEQTDGTPGFHGNLCCGACPGLPSAIADFSSYTPSLSFLVIEPQEKSFVLLEALWHPPTL